MTDTRPSSQHSAKSTRRRDSLGADPAIGGGGRWLEVGILPARSGARTERNPVQLTACRLVQRGNRLL